LILSNTLPHYSTELFTSVKRFVVKAPGGNVMELFTAVIYHPSMVMPSLCVIKLLTLDITIEWQ